MSAKRPASVARALTSEEIQETVGKAVTQTLRYNLSEGWVALSTLYQELKAKRHVTDLQLDDTQLLELLIFEVHNKTSLRIKEGEYKDVFKYQIKRFDTDTDTLVKLHSDCQTSRYKSRRLR